jgi:two-component system, OmpR family, response regulator TctD
MRILFLQDGSRVADELARMLGRDGFVVELVPCSEQMARTAPTRGCDLLIVDLSLRAGSSATLLRALEDHQGEIPTLVLASRRQVAERVQALEMGADCLAEPFAMQEVVARVRALLRRVEPRRGGNKIVYGALTVDREARRAYLQGNPVHLLPREWALLQVLLGRADGIVSKAEISQAIAGSGKPLSGNTIETYVSRLRAKLGPAALRIRAVHRVGYMLEGDRGSAATLRHRLGHDGRSNSRR